MLYTALVLLLLSVVLGLFGFGVIASTFAGIAKILFVVFLILFVLSLAFGGGWGGGPRRGPWW
jgi:uncharacterized membrane protein YtjA (UPF0391 family)